MDFKHIFLVKFVKLPGAKVTLIGQLWTMLHRQIFLQDKSFQDLALRQGFQCLYLVGENVQWFKCGIGKVKNFLHNKCGVLSPIIQCCSYLLEWGAKLVRP